MATPALTPTQAKLLRPLQKTTWRFYLFAGILLAIVILGAFAYITQLQVGLGATAMRDKVSWGVYIANFVFFIGISHVGALMSAILRLSGAEWRRPITRMAEGITVCSLFVGAAFPIIDLGRPDRILHVVFYGRLESAILWDFLSIATYLTGSLVFLYLFLIPDIALCDRHLTKAARWKRWIYRKFSAGWKGTPSQKHRLEKSIAIMTVLILPIAISVHTVVSWIFAMTLRSGWDSTIFGPYFVAGALFSGVASVLMAMALFTHFYKLEDFIKPIHFRNLAYILLLLDVVYIYFTLNEYIVVAYKRETYEASFIASQFSGEYGPIFFSVQFLGLLIPAFLLAHPRTRTTLGIVISATLVNIAMWLKRYLIVVSSMANPLLAYTPGHYFPTWVEWSITAGGFAAFILFYAVLSKVFPIVSVWEVEEMEEGTTAPTTAERARGEVAE